MSKLFSRVGSAAMLAGASLFVLGGQAHASVPTPPSCSDSTSNSTYGDLSNYYFTVDGTNYCSLAGHVDTGSTVVAHLTFGQSADTVSPAWNITPQVTLASYNVPDGNPSDLNDQTIDQCASTSSTNNSACTGGTYNSSAHTLTVVVPDCAFQVDFVFGPVISTFNTNSKPPVTYHQQNRWVDGDTGSHACTTPTPTPATPTPTPATPTPTPATPTPTPATPTATPTGNVGGASTTPTPTNTPDGAVLGITTPSTGATAGSNLGTDAAAFALLFFGFIMVGLARRRPLELS